MRSKKERKERVNRLIRSWATRADEIRTSCSSPEDIDAEFRKWCREEGIDGPQDKSLRETIALNFRTALKRGANEVRRVKAIEAEGQKMHPDKPLCPFGIIARHCQHQEAYIHDNLVPYTENVQLYCTIDPEACDWVGRKGGDKE